MTTGKGADMHDLIRIQLNPELGSSLPSKENLALTLTNYDFIQSGTPLSLSP